MWEVIVDLNLREQALQEKVVDLVPVLVWIGNGH